MASIILDKLVECFARDPLRPMNGQIAGHPCTLSLGLADYDRSLKAHYALEAAKLRPSAACDALGRFRHFGLRVAFDQPCVLSVESAEGVLIDDIKRANALFGPIFFQNLRLPVIARNAGHRAQFPQHRFHRDRGLTHENHYSLYTRDPEIAAQIPARTASTIFVSNAAILLQVEREQAANIARSEELSSRTLFLNENFDDLSASVVLEQRWDAPAGQGEVGIIDNLTVFHACRRRTEEPCYSIGVRYLE